MFGVRETVREHRSFLVRFVRFPFVSDFRPAGVVFANEPFANMFVSVRSLILTRNRRGRNENKGKQTVYNVFTCLQKRSCFRIDRAGDTVLEIQLSASTALY